jgi:hypothetical protein
VLHMINGLPAHVLLIHVVVIFVPLAAVMLVASAVWPAARAKLGFLTPAAALVALVFVPITTSAGEWFQDHLPNNIGHTNPQIVRHAHLGHELLPWVIGIFVMAVVVYGLGRRYDLAWRPRRGTDSDGSVGGSGDSPTASGTRSASGDLADSGGSPRAAGGTTTLERPRAGTARMALPVWITAVVAVLSIAVSVGGVVQLVRIGDAGAKAVWSGSTSG